MSVLGLRSAVQSDALLEARAVALLEAFFAANAAALIDRLHAAFSWFGRPVDPRSLDRARLTRLAVAARHRPVRPRLVPQAITRAWSDDGVLPGGTRALVLVDLEADAVVTVAACFAGQDEDARLLAVFDAAALIPHLRAWGASARRG